MHFSDEFPEKLRELLYSEWMITTGTGAFSASTASLANTRKQHGIFIAPTAKGFKRYVYVSKVEDQISWDDGTLDLTTSIYRDAIYPEGFKNLQKYTLHPHPTFLFRTERGTVKKSLHPIQGDNSIVIRYSIECVSAGSLKVRPILGLRYLHSLNREREIPLGLRQTEHGVFIRPGEHPVPPLVLLSSGGKFREEFCWYRYYSYLDDMRKGEDCTEDLPSPGYFLFPLREGKNDFSILFTLEEQWGDLLYDGTANVDLQIKKALRKKREQANPGRHPQHFQKNFSPVENSVLSLITNLSDNTFATAGYPYYPVNVYDLLLFLRDYLIRGGYVSTSSSIIDFLLPYLKNGLLPKYITEGGEPVYCAADTSLLFLEQLMRYLSLTGNRAEIESKLDVIGEIVHHFLEGTDFDTKMGDDYLITAGMEGVESTWMDRVTGGIHITRRYGKAVDTNALWYNALCIYRDLAMAVGKKKEAQKTTRIIPKIKSSFLENFVLPDAGYLVDVIRYGGKDTRLRPNQLFALTLTNPVISPTYGKRMIQKIKESLVTDYGLRTLGPGYDDYTGRLEGCEEERMHALFNGSVLPHLALQYSDALLYVYGPKRRVMNRIRRFLLTFRRAAERKVPYFIPEAYNGDHPHEAKGSPVSLASTGAVIGLFRLYDSIKSSP